MAENVYTECIPETDLCFDDCCFYDSLDLLIEGYLSTGKDRLFAYISEFSNYKECVYGSKPKEVDGKYVYIPHPHQKRIPHEVLDECAESLTKAFKGVKPSSFQDFEQLYQFVKEHRPKSGFKQICTYDTALRIAASFGGPLPKKYVYLHCGVLKGARALWKIDTLLRIHNKRNPMKPLNQRKATCGDFPMPDDEGNLTVPIDFFCEKLKALGATALEDFLCVCHILLEGYYLRIASSLC